KMMAGRLPVQVVDDQLEAGALHVGGQAAAHGAQPDEPHHYVGLRHPFTVAPTSGFRSTPSRPAACPTLRQASAAKRAPRVQSGLERALAKDIDRQDKYRVSVQSRESAMRPLEGLFVFDFSTLLPGPLATLLLAEAGAEVVKIEPPRGEEMRGRATKWGH